MAQLWAPIESGLIELRNTILKIKIVTLKASSFGNNFWFVIFSEIVIRIEVFLKSELKHVKVIQIGLNIGVYILI